MARTRQISPDFFLNEELAECDPEARILFIGLWCLADRGGKLRDKSRRIAAMVLPYTTCNVNVLLEQLHSKSLIVRYEVDGEKYILIPNFCKRQKVHPHEAKSILPNPLQKSSDIVTTSSDNVTANNPLPSLPSCTSFTSKESRGRAQKRPTFAKPTLEEVGAYCIERKNDIDPELFFHHYEANGWVQGKSGKPIKSWKSAIITWEKNGIHRNSASEQQTESVLKPENFDFSEMTK